MKIYPNLISIFKNKTNNFTQFDKKVYDWVFYSDIGEYRIIKSLLNYRKDFQKNEYVWDRERIKILKKGKELKGISFTFYL